MADVRPFRALRPRDDLAQYVIAPPYDVLSEEEARAIAEERRSFVRVTRSEVDLPSGADAHSDAAYAQAKANLTTFVQEGWLQRDEQPTYYLYGQKMGEHEQVGVLAAASVAEYDAGTIARHEFTRPDKEDDRTHHMDVLDAQVGLVFLTYRNVPALAFQLKILTHREPAWRVTTADGVEHTLWVVEDDWVERMREAFAEVPKLYIADGHHRSAAASRIHAARNNEASGYFLAGLFPHDALYVMAYNRVVHDLNGLSQERFLAAVGERFDVVEGHESTPSARGRYAMSLGGAWYTLVAKSTPTDPVGRLDVSVLQEQLLGPILGIDDPRRSSRIDFVGGIHGADRVAATAEATGGVGFVLYPTSLDELFAVADAGEVMPPKSTWFEPKLREGVVVRELSDPT